MRITVKSHTLIMVVPGDVGKPDRFHLEEAPDISSDKFSTSPLKGLSESELNPDGAASPAADGVRKLGQKLGAALGRDKLVARAIDMASLNARHDVQAGTVTVYPIFFRIESPAAENIPWEALWNKEIERFLALRDVQIPEERKGIHAPNGTLPPRYVALMPIGRLTRPNTPVSRLKRIVQPMLRVTAVLGAAGVDARSEWNELFQALDPLGDRLMLQVLLGDDDLRDRILDKRDSRIRVGHVGSNRGYLFSKIQAFGPNVLHFFCHGSQQDIPHLEIATRSDWYAGRQAGSLHINSEALKPFAGLESLWLTVLNSCQGAAAVGNARSLAKGLVADGMPAVIAMREPVEVCDATEFTRSFYAALSQELSPLLPKAAPGLATGRVSRRTVPSHLWARALQPSRQSICTRRAGQPPAGLIDTLAASAREWTLPVLYVHSAPLELEARPVARVKDEGERARLREELEPLRRLRDATMPDQDATADSMVSELDDLIGVLEWRLYESPADS